MKWTMRFFLTTSQFLLYRRYLNPPGGSSAQTRLPHYKSSDVSIGFCTVHQPGTVDHTQQLPTHDTVATSLSHYPVFKEIYFHVSPTQCHLTGNSTPRFLNHRRCANLHQPRTFVAVAASILQMESIRLIRFAQRVHLLSSVVVRISVSVAQGDVAKTFLAKVL